MNTKRSLVAIATGLTLAAAAPAVAHAAPSGPQQAQAAAAKPRRARASLRIDAGVTKPWVGQPVPVTVTAYFRDVEGVTLEGRPQLQSKAILTSDLGTEPRQSTELIDGERTLVVRWSGTVTPSTAGPLDLSVELPVRIRYREQPPRAAAQPSQPSQREPKDPFDEDPFSGFGLGSGDSIDSIFDRMRQRMMQRIEQPEGPLREQAVALKATAKALDARALPTDKRPAAFSGAVGKFDIDASVSSTNVHASEPVTVRLAVSGDIDPDRVDLGGVPSSEAWKAYPPRALPAEKASPAKGAPKKVFEQVVVPLHGGELTIPPVSFTAFDPTSGTYVTRSTQPIAVTVDGAPAAASAPAAATAPPVAAAPPPPVAEPRPQVAAPATGPIAVLAPLGVGLRVLPVLAFVLAAIVVRIVRRRRGDWSLRRAMRRAASGGDVSSFLGSAHDLIAARLSERWGVPAADVTARSVQERLGDRGEPLADVLVAQEKLRFGRGDLDGADPSTLRPHLRALCTSVERSLRGAT